MFKPSFLAALTGREVNTFPLQCPPANLLVRLPSIRKDADFTDRSQWPGQIEWLAKDLKKFTEVFGPVAKGVMPSQQQIDFALQCILHALQLCKVLFGLRRRQYEFNTYFRYLRTGRIIPL